MQVIYRLSLFTTLILLINCSDEVSLIDENPPIGCLSYSVQQIDESTEFGCETIIELNASCTIDSINATRDIKVRWDLDNDGNFDTEFDTVKTVRHSYNISTGQKSITMEAMDLSGNTSILTQHLFMTKVVTKSDLVAGFITISPIDQAVNLDTVKVGEEFLIFANKKCIGDFSNPFFTTSIYLDGNMIGELESGCSGGSAGGCGGGSILYSISQPGTYELYFNLDSSNKYEEENENNNRSFSKTLIVAN